MLDLASFQDQQIMVIDEYDVIAMRQEVRQMARQIRVDLAQQARITAAISGVARELIVQRLSVLFTVLVRQCGGQPALEVRCDPQIDSPHAARIDFEHNRNVNDARRLVDEAEFSSSDGRPQLTLRIWIERPEASL